MSRRVGLHNQRKGKNGVFKAKHNDCTYLPEDERPNENIYWSCYGTFTDHPDFEKDEKEFYEKHFKNGLDFQNEKHKKARNYKRIKTMDDWYTNSQKAPDETLYYLGSKDESFLKKDVIKKIISEQIGWEQKTFPNIKVLTVGFHFHEDGAPHIHKRSVYIGHDEQGNKIPYQEGALEEMGIEISSHYSDDHQRSKERRYANRKITYTDMCRAHLIQVCEKYGLEIITEPRDPKESGMDKDQYIIHKAYSKADEILNDAKKQVDSVLEQEKANLKKEKAAYKSKIDAEVDSRVETGIALERQNLAFNEKKLKKDREAFDELVELSESKLEPSNKSFINWLFLKKKSEMDELKKEYQEWHESTQNKINGSDLDFRTNPISAEQGYEK